MKQWTYVEYQSQCNLISWRYLHETRFCSFRPCFLLYVWFHDPIRATHDVDLLGFGDFTPQSLLAMMKRVCAQQVLFHAHLGDTRIRIQVDIGLGDSVSPQPVELEYSPLLDFPVPELLAYCPETSIAEKLHAMSEHGKDNSRMRDFFDIRIFAERMDFESDDLIEAIRHTFSRRESPLPNDSLLALTPAFVTKETELRWGAFARKNRLIETHPQLAETHAKVCEFLLPLLRMPQRSKLTAHFWNAGGPWSRLA